MKSFLLNSLMIIFALFFTFLSEVHGAAAIFNIQNGSKICLDMANGESLSHDEKTHCEAAERGSHTNSLEKNSPTFMDLEIYGTTGEMRGDDCRDYIGKKGACERRGCFYRTDQTCVSLSRLTDGNTGEYRLSKKNKKKGYKRIFNINGYKKWQTPSLTKNGNQLFLDKDYILKFAGKEKGYKVKLTEPLGPEDKIMWEPIGSMGVCVSTGCPGPPEDRDFSLCEKKSSICSEQPECIWDLAKETCEDKGFQPAYTCSDYFTEQGCREKQACSWEKDYASIDQEMNEQRITSLELDCPEYEFRDTKFTCSNPRTWDDVVTYSQTGGGNECEGGYNSITKCPDGSPRSVYGQNNHMNHYYAGIGTRKVGQYAGSGAFRPSWVSLYLGPSHNQTNPHEQECSNTAHGHTSAAKKLGVDVTKITVNLKDQQTLVECTIPGSHTEIINKETCDSFGGEYEQYDEYAQIANKDEITPVRIYAAVMSKEVWDWVKTGEGEEYSDDPENQAARLRRGFPLFLEFGSSVVPPERHGVATGADSEGIQIEMYKLQGDDIIIEAPRPQLTRPDLPFLTTDTNARPHPLQNGCSEPEYCGRMSGPPPPMCYASNRKICEYEQANQLVVWNMHGYMHFWSLNIFGKLDVY